MEIHPTALIEDGARLGVGCVIHPYALISRHCELGDGVVVHPFAVIGGDPQDLSFSANTQSGVRIGARTVIPGTRDDQSRHQSSDIDGGRFGLLSDECMPRGS